MLPKFKKKDGPDSFRYPDGVKTQIGFDGWGRVWLPKLGWMKFRASRSIEGRIAQANIAREGDHWFISVQTEREVANQAHDGPSVGIDVGISRFATLSDGTVFISPRAFARQASQLARAMRKLARKRKGSANWKKQARRLRRLRRREKRIRHDFLHQSSTAVARRFGTVVIEDLAVSKMTRSAKGTQDNPGRGVRAKSGLNRNILDQGWSMFRRLLAYKLTERGGQLLVVNPRFTSQQCSKCGAIHADNRKSQAVFACVSCGHSENADLNASKNILRAAGLVASACGGIGHKPPVEAGTHRTGA